MFIAYIVFGIASGLIAAVVVLLSGAGLLMAFLAYSVAGIAGILGGLVWASIPNLTSEAKHTAAQRG